VQSTYSYRAFVSCSENTEMDFTDRLLKFSVEMRIFILIIALLEAFHFHPHYGTTVILRLTTHT